MGGKTSAGIPNEKGFCEWEGAGVGTRRQQQSIDDLPQCHQAIQILPTSLNIFQDRLYPYRRILSSAHSLGSPSRTA